MKRILFWLNVPMRIKKKKCKCCCLTCKFYKECISDMSKKRSVSLIKGHEKI